MSKPRFLDYEELQRMRDQGMSWRAIAESLHWNPASLRDRLARDGWYEQSGSTKPASSPAPHTTTPKKKATIKEQVYGWLKTGIEPETAAQALGKTLPALAMVCRCDLAELKTKARAEAAIEVAGAIYQRALDGDRVAINQWRRSLA